MSGESTDRDKHIGVCTMPLSKITRRQMLALSAGVPACFAQRPSSELAVEGYIFQQYAESLNQPLESILPKAFAMARTAGFTNIELNPSFFPLSHREKTLNLLRSYQFRMPSVYVGGALHEKTGADKAVATALEIADLCRPFGCRAVVNNPDPKPGDARKSDAELAVEADSLNRLGRALARADFQLRVHHHTPQLTENAREWRYLLRNTDPRYVFICVDVDWAYEGGFAPLPFLGEVGPRLRELHVRSARNKIWLEDVEDSDINYRQIAAYLTDANVAPLIVVELAYRPQTHITRPLEQDLRLSRIYTEKIFHLSASG
jgi:sugar phosphate isomerase/epimerase